MATLRLERVLPAEPAVVFAAFTDPATLARWWGPEGFAIPSADFPARAGAAYRIEMRPPDGEPFLLTGEIRVLEPPIALELTFVWEPADPDDTETLAALSFRPAGDGTRVELEQGPFETEARRDLHRDGWSDSLAKLERLLTP